MQEIYGLKDLLNSKEPVLRVHRIDCQNGYFAVPEDCVTLNGKYFRHSWADEHYSGRYCLLLPNGKAAMGESGVRPHIYRNLQECKEDALVLAKIERELQ